ncbi:carbon-nitrogen hydrolase family protein [Paralimibaculum aggregatum]|uniref:Carbon-nitrogen hydrolase family protein n=1 Tax=Paralimibaculum aggregatum TaxID=3036245 RepID=A0ABQ6LTJ1_9RHOB|nr:nitrilase-related carbon-nitrogen hydrolase [Limibaculum sp. NKW23]GMG85404.1 carbon-nitrogen hydrolase family protein [Limibaculum sp. NKW23]
MTQPHDLRVGLWQDETPPGTISEVIDQVGRVAAKACGAGVALLAFPECYLTGYHWPAAEVPGIARSVTQDHLARLSRIADRSGVAFVIGSYQHTAHWVANAAHLFLPESPGPLTYRKRALYGDCENSVFSSGAGPLIFDYGGRRFGVLICFDIEFPELVREAAMLGADTVLVPRALMAPEHDVADFLVPARAIENGISVVNGNRIEAEAVLTFIGKSQICGPDSSSRTVAAPGFRGPLHAPLSTAPARIDYVEEAMAKGMQRRAEAIGKP